MSALVDASRVSHFLDSARQKVDRGAVTMGNPTAAAASRLAADLHTIAGEAAMLDMPELSEAAAQAEGAASLLARGRSEALLVCARALRGLGYLLQQQPVAAPRAAEGDGPECGEGQCRLLVVDDSPVAALALADVLEMQEFCVRTASTFEQALEQIASFEPSVLVSDVHMPNVDVVELCRQFRATAAPGKGIVILVSARARSELQERLSEIKPDGFVSKLSGTAEVVSCVRTICQESLR